MYGLNSEFPSDYEYEKIVSVYQVLFDLYQFKQGQYFGLYSLMETEHVIYKSMEKFIQITIMKTKFKLLKYFWSSITSDSFQLYLFLTINKRTKVSQIREGLTY